MAQFSSHGALVETMSAKGFIRTSKISGEEVTSCWVEINNDSDKGKDKATFFFAYPQDLAVFCENHNIEIEVRSE